MFDVVCELSVEQVCEVSAIKLIDFELLIACIYRSNLTHCNEFFPVFENVLDKIVELNFRNIIIVGDFNIDTLVTSPNTKKLTDILYAHDLVNVVDFPTRVRGASRTSLDHVYVWRGAGASARAAPVTTHVGDHLAVRAQLDCVPACPAPATVTTRQMTRANKMTFVASVESVDWQAFYTCPIRSVDDDAKSIINTLYNKIQICFPLRTTTIRTQCDQWVSEEILNTKRTIFDLLELNAKLDDPDLHRLVNIYTDKYKIMLTRERTSHLSNKICDSENKCKAMWQVVNEELGRHSRTSVDFTDLVKTPEGCKYASKVELLTAMNKRFVEAATECNAPKADLLMSRAMLGSVRRPLDRSLRFRLFTPREVHIIITRLIPPKPSKDIYDMSCDLMRLIAPSVCTTLAALYNRCIREGIYPVSLKRVKISPIFKGKGKKEDGNAYRPVAIIPAPAKVLESGISARLTEFLNDADVLTERQYAYRAGRSTTDLTREVVWQVLRARDANRHVAVLCCDLSKAFDVADHSIVTAKLEHYGVRGPALNLLSDFMSDRQQVVVGERGLVRSLEMGTEIGVPQGSSVSNIIFSLLMNDLPDSIPDAHVTMYADDVAATVTGSSVEDLEERLCVVAGQLAKWFRINGLALNPKKTHLLHFNLAGRRGRPLQVTLENETLSQVNETCFLGFRLDSGLFWDAHIDWLCGRLGGACFALSRLAATVPSEVVRSCYFATIQSLLTYGIELWGRAADWHRVFVMQKRAVRAIARVRCDESARDHFIALNLLTVPSLYILQVALFVRKNLQLYKQSQRARRAGQLLAVQHRLARCAQSVHVCGPEVYNALPTEIKDAPSLPAFKQCLKRWLVQHAFYTVGEFISRKT
ncbi:uncharacterized protein LOC125489344 [Plutella xylostella]|uniref:uncharacterized protein LOC125489344 n=1 Tax=Plutella xylostella TaxID=51655 RepID=UPI0020328B6E|nr:uncharacterized protein LOC125489344 [Plutella xylostella]